MIFIFFATPPPADAFRQPPFSYFRATMPRLLADDCFSPAFLPPPLPLILPRHALRRSFAAAAFRCLHATRHCLMMPDAATRRFSRRV